MATRASAKTPARPDGDLGQCADPLTDNCAREDTLAQCGIHPRRNTMRNKSWLRRMWQFMQRENLHRMLLLFGIVLAFSTVGISLLEPKQAHHFDCHCL
jgi:hypothetical protein